MGIYPVNVIINGKTKTFNVNEDDVMLGLNSGQPFKNQWIFLDIDGKSFEDVVKLSKEMMFEENLRRVMIVKSTDKHSRWHVLSFSPRPYPTVLGILSKYGTDGAHLAKTQDNGFSTIRVTEKNGFKPVVAVVIDNKGLNQQLHFYDYDAERAYKKLIGDANG